MKPISLAAFLVAATLACGPAASATPAIPATIVVGLTASADLQPIPTSTQAPPSPTLALTSLPTLAAVSTPNPADGIVGAIRWDAWVGDAPTFGDATSDDRAGVVVERTLGPSHWHYRLPFYAIEVGENEVQVRGDTQSILDQEILYAAAAGLDYWAFVYYEPGSGLDSARNLYLSSPYRDAINFSLILAAGSYALDQDLRQRLTDYFQMPTYQKVLNGRPLLYFFGDSGLTRDDIESLRADVGAAGLSNPYLVYLGWSATEAKAAIETFGLDAGSAYAQAGEAGQPFVELAQAAEQGWEAYRESGLRVIPWITTGWDPRPRIENPTPWAVYPEDQWAQPATPSEIASHLHHALQWIAAHPEAADTSAILIYAWNEFDEGGWLCPTLYAGSDRLDAISALWSGP